MLILPDSEGYSAVIDNKAYSKYSISNDHHNRMVHNYIGNLGNYYSGAYPLAFFSYIAGGFSANIERQLQAITGETGVRGSAMPVSSMIELIKRHGARNYSHSSLRQIFSIGRQVLYSDIE